MDCRVLDAVRDRMAWHGILARLPVVYRDLYFTPEWVALHARGPTASPCLYVYEEGGEILVHPFVLRRLSQIGHSILTFPAADIESAYGYAGPGSTCVSPRFLESAWGAYDEWCKSQYVVAEFVRLHPLLKNERLLPERVIRTYDRETVSIDLIDVGAGGQPYSSKARNMIRRCVKAGGVAVTLSGRPAFDEFRTLYSHTMIRIGAPGYYHWDEAYFENLYSLLERTGVVIGVKRDGRLLAAGLFLKGARWMHYHLSASLSEGGIPGAVNLMLHKAALLGAQEGLSHLHLGGGTSGDAEDSLLYFKKSMSTLRHQFHIGRRVHDEDTYEELECLWRREHRDLHGSKMERLIFYRDD